MDELVTWLRAQLDEDEQVAYWAGNWAARPPVDDTGIAIHIARHDPTRALAEVDAKRRILDLHAPAERDVATRVAAAPGQHAPEGWTYCGTCGYRYYSGFVVWPCETVHLLALPYADRPGYREEWRP